MAKMWESKLENFNYQNLLILGYVHCFITFVLGSFLMINGFMFFSNLGIYAPIIGSEFYKVGFCIGSIGCLLVIASIYGAMALKEQSCKLLQFYSCLIVLLGFGVALTCISGYYFTKIPDLCKDNVGVYGRMSNYFMSDDGTYDAYLMKEMQKDFQCCGVDSIKDFYMKKSGFREMPTTCYPENSCSIDKFINMEDGCFHKISFYINRSIYSNALIGIISYITSVLGISILHTISVFLRQSSIA